MIFSAEARASLLMPFSADGVAIKICAERGEMIGIKGKIEGICTFRKYFRFYNF